MEALTESKVIIEDAGAFKILYDIPKDVRVVVCIGGRGGRKTYEVSKLIAKKASIDKKRCVILRDEKEQIRESILSDILKRYDAANEYGHLSLKTERLESGIKDKATGDMLVFTKGFRASTSAKSSNLKGSANIDIAVVEEAEDIRDETKFNTFHDSIRKEGAVVIIILNTPDIGHWIIKRYFNTEQALDAEGKKLDGYFKIIPKQIKGFLCIQSSYLDNPYLPEDVIDRYESYGNKNHPNYNLHYYLTSILGYASSGRKGQILTNVKSLKLREYLALPFKEYYGQDFGTSRPAGLVGVKFDKNNSYCREINYLPKDVKRLGMMYCTLKFGDEDKIIADSAEPETIKRLKDGWKEDELSTEEVSTYPRLLKGFHIAAPVNGKGLIKTGISLMQGMNLFAVEESANLWNEIRNYIEEVDKNGNPTGEPVDDFNHLIDPWRYVIVDRKGLPRKFAKKGYLR